MSNALSKPIIIIGLGEMGSVFARAFLGAGHPVYPVLRATGRDAALASSPDPALALVAVAEDDIHPVLGELPAAWKDHVGLLQNELLPRDWAAHGIEDPTVAVVWFEKKPGQHIKVIVPTLVGGPAAGLVVAALGTIGIPAEQIGPDELDGELVQKNLYILTANIAGMVTGGTVGEMWERHRPLAEIVAGEVLDVQEWLVGKSVDRSRMMSRLGDLIAADPDHGAMGRTAPKRLARALAFADEAGIDVPQLEAIQREHVTPA